MSLAQKPKSRSSSSIHHKKRVGQHRKQTKPFLNAYLPYLPLFGLAAIVVVFGGLHYMGAAGAAVGGGGMVIATIALAL